MDFIIVIKLLFVLVVGGIIIVVVVVGWNPLLLAPHVQGIINVLLVPSPDLWHIGLMRGAFGCAHWGSWFGVCCLEDLLVLWGGGGGGWGWGGGGDGGGGGGVEIFRIDEG